MGPPPKGEELIIKKIRKREKSYETKVLSLMKLIHRRGSNGFEGNKWTIGNCIQGYERIVIK